jgi:hypothetical protein
VVEAAPLAIVTPLTTSTFISMSNIVATPTNNSFTVTFDTDIPCLMAMDFWGHNDPSLQAPLAGSILEGVLRMRHSIASGALPAGNHAGYYFGYSLRLDANDVSGGKLRSQQGFVRLTGARVQRGLALPVRWNQFGDGTRPPNGGGSGPRLEGSGNWSSYTWAQYNPKMTTYPAP